MGMKWEAMRRVEGNVNLKWNVTVANGDEMDSK
jgi:hypothetical protein